MHSNDFRHLILKDEKTIDGKTQEEWEASWEILGPIARLKQMGWHRYQWSHMTDEDQAKYKGLGCFAEFFSNNYFGYLRGDGTTVLEAVLKCIRQADRFVACGLRPEGHNLQSPPGYSNGYCRCTNCGFCGHSPEFYSLKRHLENARDHLRLVQNELAKLESAVKRAGMEIKGSIFCDAVEVIPTVMKRKSKKQ